MGRYVDSDTRVDASDGENDALPAFPGSGVPWYCDPRHRRHTNPDSSWLFCVQTYVPETKSMSWINPRLSQTTATTGGGGRTVHSPSLHICAASQSESFEQVTMTFSSAAGSSAWCF